MLTLVPDLIQPLVAYRIWWYSIDARGVRVGAAYGEDGTWPGAERRHWVTASCSRLWLARQTVPRFPHRAPNEYCTCGFYSIKGISDAEEILMMVRSTQRMESMHSGRRPGEPAPRRRPGEPAHSGFVFGRVELAGKVIEHRLGYRAERARILELIPLGEHDGATGTVARLLGVPTADALDVSTIDRVIDQVEADSRVAEVGGRLRPLTLVERLRLMAHRRAFRLITGGPLADGESS